jgi:mono/diheme cytochrome c family protein
VYQLHDFLIKPPLSEGWTKFLLFVFFSVHILFVLLTLGTAIIASFYYFRSWRPHGRAGTGTEMLAPFTAHKSLAVVFGVGPLLLIQAGLSTPFFMATSLLAPWWMLIIVLLIISFIFFDAPGKRFHTDHPFIGLAVMATAIAALLIVPAIFTLTLSVAENPNWWGGIAQKGFLSTSSEWHWLLRYLHVLGAAIVFGGAFYYFLGVKYLGREGADSMVGWMVGGVLLQFISGPLLTLTVSGKLGFYPSLFMVIGISAAAILLWTIFKRSGKSLSPAATIPLMIALLVSMLLVRQFIQDSGFSPVVREAERNRVLYAAAIEPFRKEALDQYKARLATVYDNGGTIFKHSCAFCHGGNAAGNGPEAPNLSIRPEDISSIRTTRDYLYKILVNGVSDTSMPYFSVFDKDKIDDLITYLDRNYRVLGPIEPLKAVVSQGALKKAEEFYKETCSNCHGMDGRGGKISLKPAPPDFTQYNLVPEKAFEVVSKGYPGTAMPSFVTLPEDVRWGLARLVNDFYKKTKSN